MSSPYPPPYPTGPGTPHYSTLPDYGRVTPAAAVRPYSPWLSAVLAYIGGLGLRLLFGLVLGLVIGLLAGVGGLVRAGSAPGRFAALLLVGSLAVALVIALLQGSYLAKRGAARPYAAALTAAVVAVLAGLAFRPLGPGLPLLAGAVAEITIIALITARPVQPATRA